MKKFLERLFCKKAEPQVEEPKKEEQPKLKVVRGVTVEEEFESNLPYYQETERLYFEEMERKLKVSEILTSARIQDDPDQERQIVIDILLNKIDLALQAMYDDVLDDSQN